ncbi:hypothetical protein [Burkholderia cepacia]|uniref:hypothetical protein n=1 Tax=Burkholderia cepacia TaxID=292 RepID=UPI002AB61EDB|nr:hypothetical protein [Burkholderia cepacia]
MIDEAPEQSAPTVSNAIRNIGIDARVASLSAAQIRVMRLMSRGLEAQPGSGSTITIDGQRVCNIDTMMALNRAGFVEQGEHGRWRATVPGLALRNCFPKT